MIRHCLVGYCGIVADTVAVYFGFKPLILKLAGKSILFVVLCTICRFFASLTQQNIEPAVSATNAIIPITTPAVRPPLQ
jgi:hypothetical protein